MDNDAAAGPLPGHLRSWLARCLAEGYSAESVCRTLVERGHDAHACRSEAARVVQTPEFAAAVALAKRRDKLASLLDVLSQQFRRTPAARSIPVMDPADGAEFFERYYYGNRPVLVRGLMAQWPALTTWTPGWLRDTYGDVVVEVAAGREDDERFEENFERHRRRIRLAEFVDASVDNSSNDMYLVSKNRLLDQSEFVEMTHHFDAPAGFLRPDRRAPGLWFGPGGTSTPLHHDSTNIFFGQVYGSKRVRLISPFEISSVYNDRSCYSAVDLDVPDLRRHPRIAEVAVVEATVMPGDFLLIPVGWWHAVDSLSTSISLSFQNFAVDGAPVVWRWREAELKPRGLG